MSKANVKKDVVGADSKNKGEVNEFTINCFLEEMRRFTQVDIEQEPEPQRDVEGSLQDSQMDFDSVLEGKVNMYLMALLM